MRKPSITRTIKTANVTVLGADLGISELVNKTFPVYASEIPKNPDITLDTTGKSVVECVDYLVEQLGL